jgi:putative transposase
LLGAYGDTIKNLVLEIADHSDFLISELEVDKDHLHLMIESDPKLSPLQIVRRLKQESTVRLWKHYPELKNHFWKENTFWSDGYFCSSIGNASIETVRKYIESQG